MESAISYKNIWKVAFPIMISGVAQNIVTVIDTAFLGQLSNVALGAAGNAGILYFVIVITGMGFTTGTQIIIGRRNGEKKFTQIGKLFDQSIYVMVPLGILLLVLVYFYSPEILAITTSSESILQGSIEFLSYRIFGILFAFMNFVFVAFYVGTTKTKVLIFSTAIMMVVNVFLDYSFIFGNFGFPQLGIKGAALASVISEMTSLLFLIFFTFLKVDISKYELFVFPKVDFEIIRRIFKIGTPIMFQSFLAMSSWFFFFMIIEKIGESELAVSHIVRSIYMVLMIPLFGLSNATHTLVSNLIGEGGKDKVLVVIRRIMILALSCTAVVLVFNIVLPDYIIRFYTKDYTLYSDIKATLQVVNFTMFSFCIAFILFSGVTGTGNTKVSLLIEFITISIYLVAAYYIALVMNLPIAMVWCSELVYFVILGLLSFSYLRWGDWKSVEV